MNKMYLMVKELLIGLFLVSLILMFVTMSLELFVILSMVILFTVGMVMAYRSYLNEEDEVTAE
ncbi:hypothetical protein [Rossellomorea marisflavi]|uniref:hypothetical protein n=1 Tax=Rossellomorea marisflavi TaxID=189381 RepID=UPI003F9F1032